MSETILPPFDVDTITLGEGLAVEQASGMDIRALTQTTSGQLLVAVFISLWRSSGQKPSWSELTDLQISGISFGSSQPAADSPGPKSSD